MFGLAERKQFAQIKKASEPLYESPKSVQETIEVKRVSESGIFEVADGRFSKSYAVSDINYVTRNADEEVEILGMLCKIFDSLDVPFKFTINNKYRDLDEFEQKILYSMSDDGLNHWREEFNELIRKKIVDGRNGIVQERYFTVTVERSNFEEAKAEFATLETTLSQEFAALGSKLRTMNGEERMQILFDFYHAGLPDKFEFQFERAVRTGTDWKNIVAGPMINYNEDTTYFKVANKYGRVIYIEPSYWPNSILDEFLMKLANLPIQSMLSIDYSPIPRDVVQRTLEDKYMEIEKIVEKQQRKRNEQKSYSSDISYPIRKQKKEIEDMMDDLSENDQNMFFVAVSILFLADSLQELENCHQSFSTICNAETCRLSTYSNQRIAVNTVLPIGVRQVSQSRSMMTQSAAALTPFYVQELQQSEDAIYYGINQVSKNAIYANRKRLNNGNGFVFAVPGSGKSMSGAKTEISGVMLSTEDDVIIVDPTHEYKDVAEMYQGTFIALKSNSSEHMNPLDLDVSELTVEDENGAIHEKCELMLGICEQGMRGNISQAQETIIDRTVTDMYEEIARQPTEKRKVPVMQDFYERLKKKESEYPELRDVILSIGIFIEGSLNIFNNPTNIDVNSRMVVYGIRDLGENLAGMAMLVMLSDISNRIVKNYEEGRATWLYVDEFHVLLDKSYAKSYLISLWKKNRKLGGLCTGITQNIADVLRDPITATLVSNSEHIVLLRQGTDDVELIMKKFPAISTAQLHYILNSPPGTGLLRHGDVIIPFDNIIDKDTDIYHAFNTNAHEKFAEMKHQAADR